MEKIRSPIITVVGHVDHGKTTLLDSIRQTKVAEEEVGGITQKISFTVLSSDEINKKYPLIEKQKIKLEIPGFLFIDTPGHAAFSHLRKRGGSLADLAILVIDINEGIMPQTKEVIELLKINKTPFIIALNKIDNVSGWKFTSNNLKENINSQPLNIKNNFNEKLFTLISSLYSHGFDAKIFYEITDFTKELVLVPCSAKNKLGIQEIILTLVGLSQKFLKQNLKLGREAKGVIFEIKKEAITYIEAILYDGSLNLNDKIAIASFSNPIITKIRVLEQLNSKFIPVKKVSATAGIRMQLINDKEILPGMPFTIFKNNLQEIEKEFKKELSPIKTDKIGIVIKADSLGSLEALITILKQNNINIVNAGIGKITKKDIISAEANLNEDPLNAVILGFNVEEDDETKELLKNSKIKIIKDDIIYKLIETLLKYQKQKSDEIKKQALMKLAPLSKLTILHNYVFRNSNPAVFGIRVEAGKLTHGTALINESGEVIGKVKSIQEENKSIKEAEAGKEIAISIPGIMFDRVLKDTDFLYSDLTEKQFKQFKENKNLLTQSEIQTLQKIAQIKRASKPTWGV